MYIRSMLARRWDGSELSPAYDSPHPLPQVTVYENCSIVSVTFTKVLVFLVPSCLFVFSVCVAIA